MKDTSERGAAAVLIALLMVVLLGFGAIAIDVGNLYATKAKLQNGADAAALAIAQDCSTRGTILCTAAAAGKALQLAKANADGGFANVAAPTFPSPGTVVVDVSAQDANGSGVSLGLARIFGLTRADVKAESTVKWGSPSGGPVVLPVTFSECQFDLSGVIQVLPIHGTTTCVSSSPSGHIIPGGFGWLQSDPGKCGAAISVANPAVQSSQGVSEPGQCSAVFDSLENQIIILPVFDDVDSSGNYHIKGFAAFQLLGFNFPGHSWNNNGVVSCKGSCKGLIGKFVQFTSLSDFTLGGPDLGAKVVRLSG
ncbi:pilus assembly protein TadG-related protein [Arthrobacter sp. MI7-26]|uniref:TadE/TadG family type IV pilus assembly protein n=1 Tax=Arthrobacter sp. MI7-26 TaxID=2993653 RepID=UPI0022487C7D|nr:pilus assembly protein TadG-related protein [Arthrobacter sp. MI7-26]MCX2747060.1 pilus assembly protein TadG-related protein [Arthrobacter sp. MI7-26]